MGESKRNNTVDKGSRQYLKKELRRAQIVAAARPVFARKGFHGTSIEDIIAAAGVAQGTLYLHFTNKHEVFHDVMRDALAKITEISRPLADGEIKSSASDTEAVFAYIRNKNLRILRAVGEDRDLFRIILREAPGLDRRTDEILARIHAVIVGQVQTELAIFRSLDLIGPTDPELSAPMVVGTMVAAIIRCMIGDVWADLDCLAEQVTQFQFFGFGRRHDQSREP